MYRTRSHWRLAAPGLLLALLLLLAACGGDTSSAGATPTDTPPPATATTAAAATPSGPAVTLSGLSFNPDTLTVKAGSTVTWTNMDNTTHTVTSATGAFDKAVGFQETFSFTFTKAGTYHYHCKIHPTMTGTIVVTA